MHRDAARRARARTLQAARTLQTAFGCPDQRIERLLNLWRSLRCDLERFEALANYQSRAFMNRQASG